MSEEATDGLVTKDNGFELEGATTGAGQGVYEKYAPDPRGPRAHSLFVGNGRLGVGRCSGRRVLCKQTCAHPWMECSVIAHLMFASTWNMVCESRYELDGVEDGEVLFLAAVHAPGSIDDFPRRRDAMNAFGRKREPTDVGREAK